MKEKTAFFAVARKYLNSELWLMDPFSRGQAWLDLVGRASYEDGELTKRGELLVSERNLAKRWKWTTSKVRRFLQFLEAEGMITRSSNRSGNRSTWGSVVTIEKYEDYQNPRSSKRSNNRSDERHLYNNKDNIDNISLYTPTGAEAEEITRLFGEKADQLIEDVRSYYQRSPDKEFPGWLEAVKLFHSNQARWGKSSKPKRKSMDDIIAEMEAEGAFK